MTAFYFVLGSMIGFVVLTALGLASGRRYSVEDTKAHSSDYANVIEEGHGGMTAFLWVTYGAIVIWMIAYLIEHATEFSVIFSG